MRYLLIILMVFSSTIVFSQKKKIAGYVPDNYEAECAGIAKEGAKMLKIWGYARRSDLATIQAKRNAVHAIIYKGASAGKCTINPLIKDSDLANEHKDYFDEFFKPGGAYLSYVALSGGEAEDVVRVKDKGRKVYKASIIVIIQYEALKRRLKKDIGLKTIGDRF